MRKRTELDRLRGMTGAQIAAQVEHSRQLGSGGGRHRLPWGAGRATRPPGAGLGTPADVRAAARPVAGDG
jgi:hypothetical protein